MADKLYDLAVKVGTYEKNGENRNRYANVGAIINGTHGPYMLLDKIFNPAGVDGQEGRSSVMISLFKPKNDAPSDRNDPASRQFQDDVPRTKREMDDSQIPF